MIGRNWGTRRLIFTFADFAALPQNSETVIPERSSCMRYSLVAMILLLLVIMTGCAGLSKPTEADISSQHYLFTNEKGDQVHLDPRALKVKDNIILAEVRYTAAAPSEKGVKFSIWKFQIKPDERLMKLLSITGYSAAGEKIADASMPEKEEVVKAEGYSYYSFVNLSGPLSKEFQGIISYCQDKKLNINTTTPPYITTDYRFAGSYPTALLFFDPASVKTEGDSLFFTARVVYDKETPKGVRYEVGQMELKPLENKFRGISRIAYNNAGKEVARDTGTDGWSKISAGSIVEALLNQVHEYCHENNIPIVD